jgi:hypothetical protein
MKITYDNFLTALCSYIDSDIMEKLPRNRRLLLGIAIMALPAYLTNKVRTYSELLKTLNIIDGDFVDLDELEATGKQLLEKYGNYEMKLMDLTIAITQDDICRLCQSARNLANS